MGNFWIAFLMCLIAGLSTGLGSLAFLFGKDKKSFLSASLGFSAGVMIYVSFVEIFSKAQDKLVLDYNEVIGKIITVISFFGGIFFVILIDFMFTSFQNRARNKKEHSEKDQKNLFIDESKNTKAKLLKTGLLTALAMAVHNFPEGLATFVAAYYDPAFAISIVVAISLHNIPEGLAVSVPIYFATGSKKRAFIISALSGLTEPIGAIIGYFVLLQFFSDALYGILFAAVAGMMVYISIKELLPSAREYNAKLCIVGFISGLIIMAVSLLLLM